MDVKEIRECPDCASPNIVHNNEREQIVCKECGLIYEPMPAEEKGKPAKKKTAKRKKR